MQKLWRHGFTRLCAVLRFVNISLVSFTAVGLMMLGIFFMTHDSLSVCLLLLLPTALLAWICGWWAGGLAGLAATALTAPYGYSSSYITPSLDLPVWIYLSVCYIGLGCLIGLQGTAVRKKHARMFADIHERLQHAQASTKRYEQLLEEMSDGHVQLNRLNNELSLLNTIATSVNSSLDISQVQSIAMAHISVLMDIEEIHLYWLNNAGDAFILQGSQPVVEHPEQVLPIATNEGLLGRVALGLHSVILDCTTDDELLRPQAMSTDIRHLLALPLRSQARMVGVLVLGRKASRAFSEDDCKFLESVGRVLAVALENARLFKQAQELSLSDELTGLANRRLFNLRLSAEIARIKKSGDPLCLTIVDLDHFKRVNDRFGHPAGDEVLRQFAQRLQNEIRSTDIFCRLGGEEFALIAVNTPFPQSVAVVERICRRIAQSPFVLSDGNLIPITMSAGIAALQPGITTADELLAAADRALYVAKSAGRNQVAAYSLKDDRSVLVAS